MKKYFKYLKFLAGVFLWPIYLLSWLMPRDPKLWAFGSRLGSRFADNPKYLFLNICASKNSSINPIWITRNKKIVSALREKNLPAYLLYSLKGIYYSLRAGVWVFDHKSNDICFWLSNGSKKVNLWHGIPLKKIEQDSSILELFRARGIKRFIYRCAVPWCYEKSEIYLTPSSLTDEIFQSAFRAPKEKLLCVGYPRCHALINKNFLLESADDKGLIRVIEGKREKGKKVILYAPTFRDRSDEDFLEMIDLRHLNNFLLRYNAIFLIKPHPGSKFKNYFQRFSGTNIYLIDGESDIYPFLYNSDILITDYSSIYFDYLYLDRPIVFFPFDIERYLKNDREMYFDYQEFTPGAKVKDRDGLFSTLEGILSGKDDFRKERANLIQKIGLRTDFDIFHALKRHLDAKN